MPTGFCIHELATRIHSAEIAAPMAVNHVEARWKRLLTFSQPKYITAKNVDINIHRQKMGMVFQHFNLFPHKTILDNMILSPVKVLKMPKEQAVEKALEEQK